MKRVLVLFGVILSAFLILGHTGTGANSVPFESRFDSGMASGESGDYLFDKAHSFIGFKVRHMGLIEVPGFFRDFTGKVSYDAKDVARSTVEFSAKVTSVDTGVAPRDNHLRSADFFEVDKYPDLTFKSTKVEMKGKQWFVTGDFTMKGVTRSITFPFDIVGWLPGNERAGTRMGISAQTTINRRDYGINYGQTLPGGVAALSDEVKIDLQIEAGMAKAAPAQPK